MVQSKANLRVFFKKNKDVVTKIIICMHIVDTLMIGTDEMIVGFKEGLGQRFSYNEQQGFIRHLSAWYQDKRDEKIELYLEANMKDLIDLTEYSQISWIIVCCVSKLLPGGANEARELCRHLSSPRPVYQKEVKGDAGYLLRNQN